MHAAILGVEYALPIDAVSTRDLMVEFPEWEAEKLAGKTGIEFRHVASSSHTASDLAAIAAQKLFASGICTPRDIDFVLFCTHSPDYALPTTACLLQIDCTSAPMRALSTITSAAQDTYGLGLAEGLVRTNQAKCVLLLTADMYSRYLDNNDRDCRTIFGDGAAATFIGGIDTASPSIGPFIYGTDGIVVRPNALQIAAPAILR